MSNKRMEPRERRAQLLTIALERAKVVGYSNITRQDLADHAGIVPGTVSLTFGTMPKLKRDVMRHAIKMSDLTVIGQGLVAGDRHAKKVSDKLKTEAMNHIIKNT